MAARPTPPAPAWMSTVSPARRWPNSKRQSSAVPYSIGTPGRLLEGQAVGNGPGAAGRHAHHLGVRAVAHAGDHRLADVEVLDSLADLADHARGLVADDVRGRGQDAALAVEQVTALDADGGHVDEQPAGAEGRLGDLLVAEHLGPAGLVVHRSLHGRRTYRFARGPRAGGQGGGQRSPGAGSGRRGGPISTRSPNAASANRCRLACSTRSERRGPGRPADQRGRRLSRVSRAQARPQSFMTAPPASDRSRSAMRAAPGRRCGRAGRGDPTRRGAGRGRRATSRGARAPVPAGGDGRPVGRGRPASASAATRSSWLRWRAR